MDLKIFVDTDSDIRLARRLKRDITERDRDLEGVLKQYNKFVKPAFKQFIEPSVQYADIVVPRGKHTPSFALYRVCTGHVFCLHFVFPGLESNRKLVICSDGPGKVVDCPGI